MRPTSQQFKDSLSGSHRMATKFTLTSSWQTGVSPTGTQLVVSSGDARFESGAAVRGSLDLTISADWAEVLPYGDEIYPARGIVYGDGASELVGLGYYRITRVSRATGGLIRIEGKDRNHGIVRARLLTPRQYLAGAEVGAIVDDLVLDVYPTATIEWDDNTYLNTIPRGVICERDRYKFLDDLITSQAKVWYWDYRGVLVIRTPPSPTVPVWDVTTGQGGVLVSLDQELTEEGTFNAVVVEGEGSDTVAPARGVAIDNNPTSPTYFYGTFGKAPTFFSSSFITTNTQAQAVADSMLEQELGLPYNVNFSAVPNPALELLDAVKITTPEGAEVHVVEGLTIPLTYDGAFTAATREQALTFTAG